MFNKLPSYFFSFYFSCSKSFKKTLHSFIIKNIRYENFKIVRNKTKFG